MVFKDFIVYQNMQESQGTNTKKSVIVEIASVAERLKTLKDECKCLANCEDVNYVVEEFDIRLWFLGSSCQFGLKACPRMRLKRDLIFGFTDVLG